MKGSRPNFSSVLRFMAAFIFASLITGCSSDIGAQIEKQVITSTPLATETRPGETMTPENTQTSLLTATLPVTAPVPHAAGVGYGFETGMQGWIVTESETEISKPVQMQTTTIAYAGAYSLEVQAELHDGGDDVYRHTEVIAYFHTPPEGLVTVGPYDWTGRVVTCYAFFPASLASQDSPAYARIIVKDNKHANIFSEAVDITNETKEQWIELTVEIPSNKDPNFDATNVNAIGVRVDTHDGFPLQFKDSFLIDECRVR